MRIVLQSFFEKINRFGFITSRIVSVWSTNIVFCISVWFVFWNKRKVGRCRTQEHLRYMDPVFSFAAAKEGFQIRTSKVRERTLIDCLRSVKKSIGHVPTKKWEPFQQEPTSTSNSLFITTPVLKSVITESLYYIEPFTCRDIPMTYQKRVQGTLRCSLISVDTHGFIKAARPNITPSNTPLVSRASYILHDPFHRTSLHDQTRPHSQSLASAEGSHPAKMHTSRYI